MSMAPQDVSDLLWRSEAPVNFCSMSAGMEGCREGRVQRCRALLAMLRSSRVLSRETLKETMQSCSLMTVCEESGSSGEPFVSHNSICLQEVDSEQDE